ncbi:rhomboid family intramembrane serine protease [Bacillus tianshenii]|nr:rhomboid family intramembrane serine protease [Bacillus tianshenii]
MFVRTEDFRSFLRLYPVVSLITGLNLFLWIYTTFFPGGGYVLQQYIGSNAAVAQGELWRLVTPIFLHGSFTHVLFNSFSFVLFGPALEHILGKYKFITAYLATGIAANIATFFLSPPYLYHLGASGALFGLFGIYLYMVRYRKDLIDSANSQIIIAILVIGLVMTFARPNINMVGHIFGFISGALLSPLFLGRPRKQQSFNDYEITFNPNRWKKRQGNSRNIFWVVLIVLALIGFISKFL